MGTDEPKGGAFEATTSSFTRLGLFRISHDRLLITQRFFFLINMKKKKKKGLEKPSLYLSASGLQSALRHFFFNRGREGAGSAPGFKCSSGCLDRVITNKKDSRFIMRILQGGGGWFCSWNSTFPGILEAEDDIFGRQCSRRRVGPGH